MSSAASRNGGTFTEGVLAGEVNVPTARDLTFYVQHGELFAEFCAGVTLIAIIVSVIRRKWL